MKISFILITFCFSFYCCSQNNAHSYYQIKEDYNKIIQDLSRYYIYLNDKNVDFDCIKNRYSKKIHQLKNNLEKTLFFEYLLDEFYDSHLILNISTNNSYRLHSPLYVTIKDNKVFVENVWVSQIENADTNIIGAEILKLNGINFKNAINNFPTECNNKNQKEVKEWIANKIISGRYNQPRILTLKLKNDKIITLDVDKIKIRKETNLLSSYTVNNIGVIKINNSLGNNNLINAFDIELDKLFNTKALILDLRNTVDGGNTYVARAIMGRFIDKELPYQKHVSKEQYGNNPTIVQSWLEFVSPRGKQYKKPIIVIVGRWTGSMGEGLAIGLDGMQRAKIVGTEMERLAGSMKSFYFKNRNYGYRIAIDKLFHVNGIVRENYIPWYYVKQQNSKFKDDVLSKALQLLD
ncbi:S41 family peptidase [Polaribacter sargassicola]|uniref:S41 family peptidase n=1 Tax=Polaribacter sargassicola TaxID=2836891 RepID=UPI001EFF7BFB|nr:S41 family peptidase [Polaribacter sp. DS7-9]MCG1037229.1 hypothetical protein [Polaribacter sp. DS7-9]